MINIMINAKKAMLITIAVNINACGNGFANWVDGPFINGGIVLLNLPHARIIKFIPCPNIDNPIISMIFLYLKIQYNPHDINSVNITS